MTSGFGICAAALALLVAGAAQATLLDRDLDGNGVTDAFYDTDLDITWLRNANVNGPTSWGAANLWAANYSFGGYSDWRLPTELTPGVNGPCGLGCNGSEMGHLWAIELGNSSLLRNTGDFQNPRYLEYWTGTPYQPGFGEQAYYFDMIYGDRGATFQSFQFYAMAVRTGDVTPAVPEPNTHALLMLGLTSLAVMQRRPRWRNGETSALTWIRRRARPCPALMG